MRLLCELLVVAALIAAAWQKPFGERLGEAIPLVASNNKAPAATPARRALPVRHTDGGAPAGSPSGAWMWDPNRRTTLDRPAYNESRSFTGHIYYADESGRRYWLDGRGKRHYED